MQVKVNKSTNNDELERIKKMSESAYRYQCENNKRWNIERKFVYESSITEADRLYFAEMNQSPCETNVIEAHLKNILGNIIRSKPSLEVKSVEDIEVSLDVKIVEGHLQHDLIHSGYSDMIPEAADDMLSGGFTAIKCFADYKNKRSYDKNIYLVKATDPTKILFDPMAKQSHAGDGRMVVELAPMVLEQFKSEYPEVDAEAAQFNPALGEKIDWFSFDEKADIKTITIADFYEKRSKRVRLLKIPDLNNPGKFKGMTTKEYSEFKAGMEKSRDEQGATDVIPEPIEGGSEMRSIDEIWHCQFIGNQFIKQPEKTDLTELPWVRGDGNSKMIDGKMITRSYHFQARDVQRSMNLYGTEIINEVTNGTRSNLIVAEESLPTAQNHRAVYAAPNKSIGAIVYKGFDEERNGRPNPPPVHFQRIEINPVIFQAYQASPSMVAACLGNYQQQLGADPRISGEAVAQGRIESFASARPILNGIDSMLNQLGRVYLSLIPKTYTTTRTIPVINEEGDVASILVNERMPDGSIRKETVMDFDPDDLNIKIIAGVDLESERDEAFNTMMLMASRIPAAQQFFGQNLPLLIDNLNIRGKEQLKDAAQQFIKQQQQASQQQAQRPSPEQQFVQVEQQKAQNEAKAIEYKAMFHQRETQLKEQDLKQRFMKMQADIQLSSAKLAMEMGKAQSKEEKDTFDMQIKQNEMEIKVIDRAMNSMGI